MEQTRETQDKDVLLILTHFTYQSSKNKVPEEVNYQISRWISHVATCLGYFVYLFQNQEGNGHAGNLITICLKHEWRKKERVASS